MNSRAFLIRLFFSICLTGSCASGRGADSNSAGIAPSGVDNASLQRGDKDSGKANPARKLTPHDVVSMTVFGEDDLAVKETVVDENGNVMLPLLGQVKISG